MAVGAAVTYFWVAASLRVMPEQRLSRAAIAVGETPPVESVIVPVSTAS